MGMVRMVPGKYRYSDGYHNSRITYYLYCDKCGSFGIEEYRTARTWTKIVDHLFLGRPLGVFQYGICAILPNLMGLVGCLVLTFVVCDLFVTWVIYMKRNEASLQAMW